MNQERSYNNTDFYTQKGYERNLENGVTPAVEDYLEMICRLSQDSGYTRTHLVAERLHVKPSSASKMVDNLKALGYVRAEKYGCLTPTEKGINYGRYLLGRHELLNQFFCYLNNSDNELELVERIEHFFDKRTIKNIGIFLHNITNSFDGHDNHDVTR